MSSDSQKIHLVSETSERPAVEDRSPEAPATQQKISNRIEIGEYIADILVDRRSFPMVVHWIVQRQGNPEILQWGHEDTFDDAQREAIAWIDSLLRFDNYKRSLGR